MTTPLDSILSGEGAIASAPVEPTTTDSEVQQTTPEPQPEEGGEQGESGQTTVPLAALKEERAKSKRYTEALADVERKLSEQNSAWERRFEQLVATIRQPQQQDDPPDFYSNPDAAIQQYLTPLMQRVEGLSETMSRQFAVREHGEEATKSAYAEMERRLASDPRTRGEYQRIMQSGDPWGELVRWHKREQLAAEIGNDPDAYKAKVKQELLAELQQQQGKPAAGNPAPVMPSNLATARNVGARSGPAWAGPTPLADIFDRSR